MLRRKMHTFVFTVFFLFLRVEVALTLGMQELILTESKPSVINHFIEFSQQDGESKPVSLSRWRDDSQWGSFLKERRQKAHNQEIEGSPVIELNYSDSGWHLVLCPQTKVVKVSGGGVVQLPGDLFSRIYPGSQSGHLSISLQSTLLPKNCIGLQFNQTHIVFLDTSDSDRELLWRLLPDYTAINQEAGERNWIRVYMPSEFGHIEKGVYRVANETDNFPGLTVKPATGKFDSGGDLSNSLDDDKPLHPHFYGHPKEALFDIDLTLVYEETDESEAANESQQAFVELSFFSSDGIEMATILPGRLVAGITNRLDAEAPGFWKRIIKNCVYSECDLLTRTLALLVTTSSPKGDKMPENEPVDMDDPPGRCKSKCKSSSACRGATGTGQGARGYRSPGRGSKQDRDGSRQPGQEPDLIPFTDGREEQLASQFILLELAAIIGEDWENVGRNAFGLRGPKILSLKIIENNSHNTAYKMLAEAIKARNFFTTVLNYYICLKNAGFNFYANYLLLVAEYPAAKPMISRASLRGLLSGRDGVEVDSEKFIEGITNAELVAFYLGLVDIEPFWMRINNRRIYNTISEKTLLDRIKYYIDRIDGDTLPIFITALHRAKCSEILFDDRYIKLPLELAEAIKSYIEGITAADANLLSLARSGDRLPSRENGIKTILQKPQVDYIRGATATGDSAIIESIISEMQCPICLSVLINPEITGCHHTFCKECLEDLKINTKQSKPPCPICRQTITSSQPNIVAQRVSNIISSRPEKPEKQKVTAESPSATPRPTPPTSRHPGGNHLQEENSDSD